MPHYLPADIAITSSPFDCSWYRIEKFLHIHCANGTNADLKATFLFYYEELSQQYIIQQGTMEKEFYDANSGLTLRRLFERIFCDPGQEIVYQLESMHMSMVDGSPLPEETDELLNIPISEYHASHPGANLSIVLYIVPIYVPPAADLPTDDLPTEEAMTPVASQMPPSPPLPSASLPLPADADDPIELPPHLLIA